MEDKKKDQYKKKDEEAKQDEEKKEEEKKKKWAAHCQEQEELKAGIRKSIQERMEKKR